MTPAPADDPHAILGLDPGADEAAVRARYLELVKRFPPDREPDRFREIRTAFEAASDPLLLARRLIEPPDRDPPRWSDALDRQRKTPPALSVGFLLSLGNREAEYKADDAGGPADG